MPKMTTIEVEACSVETCMERAGWLSCTICGAKFCDAHQKELVDKISLCMHMNRSMGSLFVDPDKPKPTNPPHDVYVCANCSSKPEADAIRRIYKETDDQLARASNAYGALQGSIYSQMSCGFTVPTPADGRRPAATNKASL